MCSFVIRWVFPFSPLGLQNSPKNIYPSSMKGLDFFLILEGENSVIMKNMVLISILLLWFKDVIKKLFDTP